MDLFDFLAVVLSAGWEAACTYVPLVLPSRRKKRALELDWTKQYSHIDHDLIPITSDAFPGETLATLCATCDKQFDPQLWRHRAGRDLKELDAARTKMDEVKMIAAGELTGNFASALKSRLITSDEADVRLAYGRVIDSLKAENDRLLGLNEELKNQLEATTSTLKDVNDRMAEVRNDLVAQNRSFRGWVEKEARNEGYGKVGVILVKGSREIYVAMPVLAYRDVSERWKILTQWIIDIDSIVQGELQKERVASYIQPDEMPAMFSTRDFQANKITWP